MEILAELIPGRVGIGDDGPGGCCNGTASLVAVGLDEIGNRLVPGSNGIIEPLLGKIDVVPTLGPLNAGVPGLPDVGLESFPAFGWNSWIADPVL